MANQNPISAKKYFTALGIGIAANIVIFFIGAAASATYEVGQPMKVTALSVAVASALPTTIAFLVIRPIIRRKPNFLPWAQWIGVVFALISSPGGWISSNDTATGIALGLMHLTLAAAWFFGIKPAKAKA